MNSHWCNICIVTLLVITVLYYILFELLTSCNMKYVPSNYTRILVLEYFIASLIIIQILYIMLRSSIADITIQGIWRDAWTMNDIIWERNYLKAWLWSLVLWKLTADFRYQLDDWAIPIFSLAHGRCQRNIAMLQKIWKHCFNIIRMSFPFSAINLKGLFQWYLLRHVLHHFHITSSLLNEVINIKHICKTTDITFQ